VRSAPGAVRPDHRSLTLAVRNTARCGAVLLRRRTLARPLQPVVSCRFDDLDPCEYTPMTMQLLQGHKATDAGPDPRHTMGEDPR
jgi:hypothetical protein